MKDDYSYWSENLHSAYLFYTLEVDKLNKENQRLREALEKIAKQHSSKYINDGEYDEGLKSAYTIAKQALGE